MVPRCELGVQIAKTIAPLIAANNLFAPARYWDARVATARSGAHAASSAAMSS